MEENGITHHTYTRRMIEQNKVCVWGGGAGVFLICKNLNLIQAQQMGHFITQPLFQPVMSPFIQFKWAHMQKPFRNIPQTNWEVKLSQYKYERGASHFNTFGFPQLGAQLSSEGSNTFNNLHGKFKPIREVRTHFAWLELVVWAN